MSPRSGQGEEGSGGSAARARLLRGMLGLKIPPHRCPGVTSPMALLQGHHLCHHPVIHQAQEEEEEEEEKYPGPASLLLSRVEKMRFRLFWVFF